MVEERVYLDIPPQAEEWAQSAGLPIPPDTYDAIYSPPPTNPDVQIIEPEMFAYVNGVVPIYGSAAGDDFSYYRLQVGQQKQRFSSWDFPPSTSGMMWSISKITPIRFSGERQYAQAPLNL